MSMYVGERETPGPLAPLYTFFPSLDPALCKLGQLGELFILPEVLTQLLRPSFVLFLWAFPFIVFQPLTFCTLFSYSNYNSYKRNY